MRPKLGRARDRALQHVLDGALEHVRDLGILQKACDDGFRQGAFSAAFKCVRLKARGVGLWGALSHQINVYMTLIGVRCGITHFHHVDWDWGAVWLGVWVGWSGLLKRGGEGLGCGRVSH